MILGFTDSASIGENGSSHNRDLLNSDKHLIVTDFPSTVAFKYVNQRFTLPLTWKGRDRLISFRIESKISLQPSWKKKTFRDYDLILTSSSTNQHREFQQPPT